MSDRALIIGFILLVLILLIPIALILIMVRGSADPLGCRFCLGRQDGWDCADSRSDPGRLLS